MNPTGIPLSVKEFARDTLFSSSERFVKPVKRFEGDELLGSLFSGHMFLLFHVIFYVLLSAYYVQAQWRTPQDRVL